MCTVAKAQQTSLLPDIAVYTVAWFTLCYGWRVGIVKCILIVTAAAAPTSDLTLTYFTLPYLTSPNLKLSFLNQLNPRNESADLLERRASRSGHEPRATSNEQRTNDWHEPRATSNKPRATSKRANEKASNEHRATSDERRATGNERRATSNEQVAV